MIHLRLDLSRRSRRLSTVKPTAVNTSMSTLLSLMVLAINIPKDRKPAVSRIGVWLTVLRYYDVGGVFNCLLSIGTKYAEQLKYYRNTHHTMQTLCQSRILGFLLFPILLSPDSSTKIKEETLIVSLIECLQWTTQVVERDTESVFTHFFLRPANTHSFHLFEYLEAAKERVKEDELIRLKSHSFDCGKSF